MSWLHCMWGLGASGGPVIMGWALAHSGWQSGYRIISVLQVVLTAIIIFSLPLWKKPGEETGEEIAREHRTLPQLMWVPGVPEVMAMFACYSRSRLRQACGRPAIARFSAVSTLVLPPAGPACFTWASRWGGF